MAWRGDKVRLLFWQLILIFLPAKLCLVAPFHFDWTTWRPSSRGAAVNVVGGAVYYVFHLHSAYYQMISQQDTNFVTQLIDSYNQYAGCSILMAIIVNACYHQRTMVQVLSVIQDVDRVLWSGTDTECPPEFLLTFHAPSYLFVTGICCMEYYFCIMFIKDAPTYSTYCYLMCYAPLIVHVVTQLLFCALVHCVTLRLHRVSVMDRGIMSVGQLKRAFDSLALAGRLLNVAFGFPILLLIMHQFSAATTLTYDLVIAIVKYDFRTPGYDMRKIIVQVESSGGWSLFFMAETFLLCLCCHRYQDALQRARENLMQRVRELDDTPEIRWTQLQLCAGMREGERGITACGLFHVDLGLFSKMIGVITTYLIILVQFDVAQRTTILTSGSAALQN